MRAHRRWRRFWGSLGPGAPLLLAVGAALGLALLLTVLHGESRSAARGSGAGGLLLLWGALVGLMGLAAIIAAGLASGLRRDVAKLTMTAQRLLEARLDQQVRLLASEPPAATAEVDRLQRALFTLIDRARRQQVEIFLATERTIEARRAKSQHLATTSHDLRNALSPVLGFTDLLAGGYEGALRPAGQQRLLRMQRQSRRLLRILSEILDTAKLESQTLDLHPRDCAAAELLAQTVSEVRRLRSAEVLPIRVELATDLPQLAVDPIRFPQALAYLCGHVLDSLDAEAEAVAPGAAKGPMPDPPWPRVPGELVLRAFLPSSGAGVVFEVAYLPDTTPRGPVLGRAGLGLALPLARRLLALHGGSISVVGDETTGLRTTVPRVPKTR